jgi:hypothetical protein
VADRRREAGMIRFAEVTVFSEVQKLLFMRKAGD